MSSILEFWSQMTAKPLLFIAVSLTMGVILVNGWTDAPNAIATCVVTKCMPPKAAILMAAGTAMGGKKIIKSVGMDMVKLEKYQGFSADIAAAISLLFCSVFSLPVSTTHAKTTSIMGVGAVKRVSAIKFGVVKEMVLTLVLTFPGCGLVGFLMTKLFMFIFT